MHGIIVCTLYEQPSCKLISKGLILNLFMDFKYSRNSIDLILL